MAPEKVFDKIFGIFRLKIGGLEMKTWKTDKFIKIRLYMSIPRYWSTLYYNFYLVRLIFFLWSGHETITQWHESIRDKSTDSETNIIPFSKFLNFLFTVILLMKTVFELNFFLMSPWTIKNKPIKPKERLKILLIVIFWSDPSKYPFKWFAQSPWPSWLNWPDLFGSESWFSLSFRTKNPFSEPCLQWPEFQKMNSIQAKGNYARTHQVGMSKLSVLKKHDFRKTYS